MFKEGVLTPQPLMALNVAIPVLTRLCVVFRARVGMVLNSVTYLSFPVFPLLWLSGCNGVLGTRNVSKPLYANPTRIVPCKVVLEVNCFMFCHFAE